MNVKKMRGQSCETQKIDKHRANNRDTITLRNRFIFRVIFKIKWFTDEIVRVVDYQDYEGFPNGDEKIVNKIVGFHTRGLAHKGVPIYRLGNVGNVGGIFILINYI